MFGNAKRLLLSVALVVSNQAVSDGNQMGDDMEDRVVSTPSGQLQGHVSAKNASIRVFRGVPYAKPPVGEARFSPPQPVAPWEGVRDATRDLCHVGKHTQRMLLSGREGSLIGVRIAST